MTYKVYISSTREDLSAYRNAVRDAVVRLGMLPVMEDDIGLSGDKKVLEYLRQQCMSSDVFIGIYAYQYGYSYGQANSIEEMEFSWARESSLHQLYFLVDPSAPWPIQFVDRGEKAMKLDALKQRIKQETVFNYFSSMHQLQTQTYLGLHRAYEMLQQRDGVMHMRSVFGAPLMDAQFQSDVFMIMPFREQFEPIYRETIVPSIKSMGLSIKRGDDYFSNNSIMREVWAAIYNAKLVVAELTDRNANVFYELGIAHTIGKPGIMIT